MLAGFQISHSDGLKGPSHNHHIFYVHLYWVHAVKLFNLHACVLIYDKSWQTYGRCIEKEHRPIWPTVLTWFLRSPNAQKSKFSGALPGPH